MDLRQERRNNMTREEAIKILNERYSSALFSERTALETLIPGLKESESEYERTRKEIVEYFKRYSSGDNASIKFLKWIEWLENHNPSFKQISDGIIWDSGLRTGIELGKKQQEQKPAEFDEYKIIKKHITEDSLSSEVNKRLTECGWYVTDKKPVEWTELTWKDVNDLEEIMNEVHSDYRGGGIGQKSFGLEVLERFRYIKGDELDVKEQKPEWSEEDERMLSRCIKSVECSKQFADSETYKAAKDVEVNWLQSLRPQSKQEWSEDDERRRDGIIQWLRKYQKKFNPEYDSLSIESIESLIAWLKSLQPQVKQEQKPVDLEKEMDKYYGMYRDKAGETYDIEDDEPCFDWKEDELSENKMRMARHFYELGLKARKDV